ncbi:hypothetical protein [Rubellimicrobium arenae]|uniref:hypothetical protein n=1 Tax=Rubellimicrobium arenae TaxID=2817372 RepID=UPI001B313AFC|nr:hypothetical protein [Rubellimicrobium arenae]
MAWTVTLLAAMLLGPGLAQAATVTINFDDLLDPDSFGYGQVGNIAYQDRNWGLYGLIRPYLTLDNWDFVPETTFTADPGTYFTPLAFELSASRSVVRAPCPACTSDEVEALVTAAARGQDVGFEPFAYNHVRITGYRDGALVAQALFGADTPSFSGVYEVSSDFAGISSLNILLLGEEFEFPALREDGFVYACGYELFESSSCIDGRIDNFQAIPDAPRGDDVAPVPLPAGLPLYGGVLILGGLVAGWRRQGPR